MQVRVASKATPREGKMAPWVKAPAAKPGSLSLIPRTHVVEEQNQLMQTGLLQVVLWFPHVCHGTHSPPDTQINNKSQCREESQTRLPGDDQRVAPRWMTTDDQDLLSQQQG